MSNKLSGHPAHVAAVLNTAGEAIITADASQTIRLANEEAEKVFGYQSGELHGLTLHALMPDRYRDRHDSGFSRAVASDEIRSSGGYLELEGLRKDGSVFPLELRFTSLEVAGERFFTAAARDITERKHALAEIERLNDLQQQQLKIIMREKVEALAKLVAGVSHELNSPLGVIRSGLELQNETLHRIEEKLADPERKQLTAVRAICATLLEAADRISSTGESLRRFAHLDEAEFQKISLRTEVDQLLKRTPLPEGKQIEIRQAFEDLPELCANPKELGQALSTVLLNAFEAIERQGTVEIRAARVGSEIQLSIIDSGRGIPADRIPDLFDVGLRPGDARIAASFGLPAAQSVAHSLGGRISAESTIGHGSTFTFHIPVS